MDKSNILEELKFYKKFIKKLGLEDDFLDFVLTEQRKKKGRR